MKGHKTKSESGSGLVTVKEMARRLGIGTTTAWSLVTSRDIPAVRIRGTVRIRPEDIERFKDENTY